MTLDPRVRLPRGGLPADDARGARALLRAMPPQRPGARLAPAPTDRGRDGADARGREALDGDEGEGRLMSRSSSTWAPPCDLPRTPDVHPAVRELVAHPVVVAGDGVDLLLHWRRRRISMPPRLSLDASRTWASGSISGSPLAAVA